MHILVFQKFRMSLFFFKDMLNFNAVAFVDLPKSAMFSNVHVSHTDKAKKINKCFSGHFFEKKMRQAGLFSQKTDEATFLFLYFQNLMRHLFFVHFKHKNVGILILTS